MDLEAQQQVTARFETAIAGRICGQCRKKIFFQTAMLLKTPAGRKNFRQMLVDNGNNRQRLLYELALTCAQVAQVEQFELLVPAMIMEV